MKRPPGPELAWVHVDEACIVVDKPSGLPSVPGRGAHLQDCMATRVQSHYPDALVVHRLDMATSGLLLFARGLDAQRRLSASFAQREVDKRYVAVVQGAADPPCGDIDLPLNADWPNRPRQRVDLVGGKPSHTRFVVVERDAEHDTSRLALQPLTGRSHQLRVHLQALGHPILGDTLYAPDHVQRSAARLMLHAESLTFTHPVNGETIRCRCAVPF